VHNIVVGRSENLAYLAKRQVSGPHMLTTHSERFLTPSKHPRIIGQLQMFEVRLRVSPRRINKPCRLLRRVPGLPSFIRGYMARNQETTDGPDRRVSQLECNDMQPPLSAPVGAVYRVVRSSVGAPPASAKATSTSSLSGQVTGQKDTAVRGADTRLTDTSTNTPLTTAAHEVGLYSLLNVLSGAYRIIFSKSDFTFTMWPPRRQRSARPLRSGYRELHGFLMADLASGVTLENPEEQFARGSILGSFPAFNAVRNRNHLDAGTTTAPAKAESSGQ